MPKKSEVTGSAERQEAENPACRSVSEAPVEAKVSGLIAEDACRLKGASDVSSELEFDDDKIFEKIRETLVDALGVDDDEVTIASRLENDLGAESIDFLDIVFRLEKSFGIKIPRGELFPELGFDRSPQTDGDPIPEGLLEALSKGFSHFDPEILAKLKKEPVIRNISELFTVNSLADFVKKKIAESPQHWHSEYCKRKVV